LKVSENSPFVRGEVIENDAVHARSRVKFPAEDGVRTFWLSWNAPAAGGSKIYNAPDLGSQVHCLVDWRGEDGCIIGASYSKSDAPPTTNGKLLKAMLEGGLDFEYDKASGSLTLKLPAGLNIEAGSVKIKGPTEIEGASLKHNGKSIGSTHTHTGVVPGGGTTGQPS
jgi:phage baseplate assembly protein V